MNNLNKDVYECSDDEIFNELAELFPVEKKEERALTPEEERIIAGFEEIQAFYDRRAQLLQTLLNAFWPFASPLPKGKTNAGRCSLDKTLMAY